MARHANGQLGFFKDLARDRIGQRYFCRGDQPPPVGGLIAVFGEFGQLVGAIHRVVFDQNRRPHLGQAVVVNMDVQHQLGQGAVHTGDSALQHDKAAARQFGCGGEIHVLGHTRDLKVLFGGEVESARGAPAVNFDVLRFILAIGHSVQRQVGNAHQHIAQGLIFGCGFFGQALDGRFLHGDFGAQTFKLGLIAAPLGGPCFFGSPVLVGRCGFCRKDFATAVFIQGQHLGRQALQSTAREGRIKGCGVVTDGANVVHGGTFSKSVAPICPISARG